MGKISDFFKKIRDTKGISHAKMGTMDRNASNRRKRCQEKVAGIYRRTKKTKNKKLHKPDNHDCVITHLEPDILECKAKWALKHHYEQS